MPAFLGKQFFLSCALLHFRSYNILLNTCAFQWKLREKHEELQYYLMGIQTESRLDGEKAFIFQN